MAVVSSSPSSLLKKPGTGTVLKGTASSRAVKCHKMNLGFLAREGHFNSPRAFFSRLLGMHRRQQQSSSPWVMNTALPKVCAGKRYGVKGSSQSADETLRKQKGSEPTDGLYGEFGGGDSGTTEPIQPIGAKNDT